jgi:hypothetical protein
VASAGKQTGPGPEVEVRGMVGVTQARLRPAPLHRGDVVEAEAPTDAGFLSLPEEDQIGALFEALLGRGALSQDEAVRASAEALRRLRLASFARLRRDGHLYRAIARALAAGVRYGAFDRPRRGQVRAVLRDPGEYTPRDWRRALLGSLAAGPVPRDQVLHHAARWAAEAMGLQFERLRAGGRVLAGLQAALERASAAGEVEEDRGGKVRLARAPGSPGRRIG